MLEGDDGMSEEREKRPNKHRGSNFDSFLAEEGLLEECTAVAVKRVFAMQVADAMKSGHVSKTVLAAKMHSSRSQLARVLDPEETGTSIEALTRAAVAMGKRLEIRLA